MSGTFCLYVQTRNIFLFFFVCLIYSQLVFGSATAQQITTVLPETVVSATLVPVLSSRVGSSINVVTSEDIDRLKVHSVPKLLRKIPGLAVRRSGVLGSFTQVRIRGAEGNHTLVLIDGVEVNNPSGASEFDFGSLRSADIERIEVLRGPQSSIYGSDAVGGVINIIMKRGRGPGKIYLSLEGGSDETINSATSIRGSGTNYHYSLGITGFSTAGHSIAENQGDETEDDGNKNLTFNLKAGLKPSKNLEIGIFSRHVRDKTESDSQPAVAGVINTKEADEESLLRQNTSNLTLRYKMLEDNWEHLLTVGKHKIKSDSFTNGHNSFETEGEKNKLRYQTNFFYKPFNSSITHRLTFLSEKETELGKTLSSYGNTNRKITNYGYLGEYGIDFKDQASFTSSYRHDNNDIFKNSDTFRFTGSYLSKELRYRLHTSYGKGVKNPTLFELFGSTENYKGNPSLKPESSIGWDIGIEKRLFDDRLTIDATYFNNHITDLIQGSGNTSINFSGETRVEGLELAIEARVFDDFIFSGQYTYTKGKDSRGQQLVRRAKHLASLNVSRSFYGGRVSLDLGLDYNGKQSDIQFSNYFMTQKYVTLDDFFIVDVAASYKITENFSLIGRIENLLNEDYEEVFDFNEAGIGALIGFRSEFGL